MQNQKHLELDRWSKTIGLSIKAIYWLSLVWISGNAPDIRPWQHLSFNGWKFLLAFHTFLFQHFQLLIFTSFPHCFPHCCLTASTAHYSSLCHSTPGCTVTASLFRFQKQWVLQGHSWPQLSLASPALTLNPPCYHRCINPSSLTNTSPGARSVSVCAYPFS